LQWSDFKRCEVDSSVFFTQAYSVELSKPRYPSILRTSQEARTEALKYYKWEFRTEMSLPTGITVTIGAKMYINYASDVLIPRGFWNIMSFADFADRVTEAGLVHLALDVEGSFWRENCRDYCRKGTWVLNGVQELILYDSRGDTFWKDLSFLDKFRKEYKGGPKLLELESEEDKSQNVQDTVKFLLKTFDTIEGEEEKIEDGEETAEPMPSLPRYLDDCPETMAEELWRPNITVKKLVAKPIVA
jgi:2EXR family